MKKLSTKAVKTLALCGMIGALGIGAGIGYSSAYLTDKETKTNTVTVGEVKIELTEPEFPGNDDPSTKNQVPNQETLKNPTITNIGKNDAYVFLEVTVPVVEITEVADDGTKGTKQMQELFYFKDEADATTKHENNFDANWVELPSVETGKDMSAATRTYVFAYNKKLAVNAETTPLFDKVQLKNFIENEIAAGTVENIGIEAFAIQSSNLPGTTLVDGDVTSMTTVWNIMQNQNN